MKKTLSWSLPTLLAAYIGIYFVLTLLGDYHVSSSSAFGIPNKTVWQPKLLRLENSKTLGGDSSMKGNVGGFAFLPLILADRTVWHRDKSVIQGLKDDIKKGLDD